MIISTNDPQQQTQHSVLDYYLEVLGATLIVLCSFVAGAPRSKRPLQPGWRTAQHSRQQIEQHIDSGHGIGWRLPSNILVVDVDVATPDGHAVDGRESLSRLCVDYGVDLSCVPCVTSPTGGRHYYFRVPPCLRILNKLDLYPGIDFLSEGRYVVIPPSQHWQGTGCYELDALTLLSGMEPPQGPQALVQALLRPAPVTSGMASGAISEGQLHTLLTPLDPLDYRQHDDWLRLMMACHHATGGDGLDVFADWSRQDPQYADDHTIEARWESLSDRADGVTIGTLLKAVRAAAAAAADPEPILRDLIGIEAAIEFEVVAPPADEIESTIRPLRLMTSRELQSADLQQRYLIDHVLVEGQHCIVGGAKKCLKTMTLIDMMVSLSSGRPLLGHPPFAVTDPVRACLISGESGAHPIRDAAQRICRSREIDLASADVLWGFDLPHLANPRHLTELQRVIVSEGIRVLAIDPAYLCLLAGATGVSPADVFGMGLLLRDIGDIGTATGCTIILAHHARKRSEKERYRPLDLEDLAMSGFAEWARQWLLLGRRSEYEGDGQHELWMSIGGSAGHCGVYGLDVSEGVVSATGPTRHWHARVRPAKDAMAESADRRDLEKMAEQERRRQHKRDGLLAAVRDHPNGETMSRLRELTRPKPTSAEIVDLVSDLIAEGLIESWPLRKNNREERGYRPTTVRSATVGHGQPS